jgi:signal transduction histidine kinase
VSELEDSTIEPQRHQLPSGLLHDLRTPLNHIIGYSEWMMEQAQEEDPSGLLPHLQKVCAAAHHMAALIRENFESSPGPEETLADAARPDERSRASEPEAWLAAGKSIAAGELASAEVATDEPQANRPIRDS